MRLLIALFAFPLLALAQQPQRRLPAASDCAIDGIAVNAIGGAPVPRVNVTVGGPKGSAVTKADDAGHWSFTNVACGDVFVSGVRAGFLQTVVVRGTAGAKAVALVSGSPLHDYKLEMMPQAIFTGKVTDEHGDPVLNATVSALMARVVNGKRVLQPSGAVNTNDLGEFRMASLAPGRYIFCTTVSALLAYSPNTTPTGSCYPAEPIAGATSALPMSAGSEVRVDFTITSVPAFHVRGTVSGPHRGGREGVMLLPRNAVANTFEYHPVSRTVPEGFDIAGVRPGSYTLIVNDTDGKEHFRASVPIEVGNSDINEVSVTLDSSFDIPATVTTESKSGNVVKAPFRVQLQSNESGAKPAAIGWNKALTAFTVPGVNQGTYTLEVSPPPPFYLKSARLSGRDMVARENTISAASILELVLSDDGGNVDGDVVGDDGKPAPCGVMLLRNGSARSIFTDDAGHFKFTGVPPGDYTAYAWPDPQDVEYANPDWLRRFTGVPVTVNPEQTSTVKLTEQVPEPLP